MSILITIPDQKRFQAIRKNLDMLGSKESTFLKVELLFYEALNMAKTYGENTHINELLAALRNVQLGTYEKTKSVCKTRAQKERLIHQFMVQFKRAIAGKSMLV